MRINACGQKTRHGRIILNEEFHDGVNRVFQGLYIGCFFSGTFVDCSFQRAQFHSCGFFNMYTRDCVLPNLRIPEGDIIGYKGIASFSRNGIKRTILKLLIPKEAKRTRSIQGNKWRAEFAVVLKGSGVTCPGLGTRCVYKEGETVYPDSYDPTIWKECTNGIHFFLTEREAKDWVDLP